MSDLAFTGIHHLELTVRDLERSVGWYTSVLDFTEVRRFETEGRTVVLLSQGSVVIGLVQHPSPPSEPFDEHRTGLDHVGFQVPAPEFVDQWAERLDSLSVSHAEVKDGALPGSRVLIFRDPDNIQVECYYAPAR